MSPDGLIIHLITKELQMLLQGRVERVYQPEEREIILVIRCAGRNHRLLLSAQADSARVHLTTREKPNPTAPPLFCLVLRKYLEGSRLQSIRQVGLDRVVRLTFSRLSESGGFQEIVLISEIMGKHSNLILLDPGSDTIIDGIRRYSHSLSRYREVLPGRPYLPPPSQQKADPSALDEEGFTRLILKAPLDQTLEKILLDRIAGVGPEGVREILFRAGLEPKLRLEYCGDYELHTLWESLHRLYEQLLGGNCEPTLVYDGAYPVSYAPVIPARYQGLSLKRCATVNQLLDEYYGERSNLARLRQVRNHLQTVVRHESARCSKRLTLQQQTMAEAKRAESYRIQGEMLLAHLHLVKTGAREVMLPNLYREGSPPLKIELDPALSPTQNAQRLFKRYDKARDTLKIVKRRLAQTEEELTYLASVKTSLEQAETLEELNEIRSELEETGYLKPKEREKRGKKRGSGKKQRPQVLQLTSRDGLEILVGKNNRQNDYLTMHLAREHDIWLHVKEAAGSHVIIKPRDNGEIPPTTLEQAARLAAYYSEARHASKVPVDYTRRKYVTKPPKARPGYVIYKNYHTILVNPSVSGEL